MHQWRLLRKSERLVGLPRLIAGGSMAPLILSPRPRSDLEFLASHNPFGTTPFKRDSGGKGLKQASPPVMPPDVEAKPRPERAPDGPADPILSQPRLPRTGTRQSGQHPHPLSKTTPLPLHHLQQDLRRDSRHTFLPPGNPPRDGHHRDHSALPRLPHAGHRRGLRPRRTHHHALAGAGQPALPAPP